MKHIVATIAAMICLPMTSMAAVDAEQITSDIKTQFAELCLNEDPIVMELPTGPYRFTAILAKKGIRLQFSEQGMLVGANWAPKPDLYPEIGYDEDFVWSLRPDFNRDNMVNVYDGIYLLKRPDGLLDDRVRMMIMKQGDIVTGFHAVSQTNDNPIPLVNITEDKAFQIANMVASNWVEKQNDSNYNWPFVYEYPNTVKTATVVSDGDGNPYIVYHFSFLLSDMEVKDISAYIMSRRFNLPQLAISVNTTTGDVTKATLMVPQTDGLRWGIKTDKAATKLPVADVTINKKASKLGFPCVQADGHIYMPLTTIHALAKGHTVTAKADAKAFKLDGKELALPAKVLSRKGVLYLPWQSLNGLPGVKAQYDAKLAKLDITTASVTAAK